MFSNRAQLREIASLVQSFQLLPLSDTTVPGALLERIIAHVKSAEVLKKYDFVDVVRSHDGFGWQVKSTKQSTPVTWKRAKLDGAEELVEMSLNSDEACQELGSAIIEHCNAHVEDSFEKYDLETIGYCRLVVRDSSATYFERRLCRRSSPVLFDDSEYRWQWSQQKSSAKKEQLSSLHGISRKTGRKIWAWHGRGENQLHFYGEHEWWPEEDDPNAVDFPLPTASQKLNMDEFLEAILDSTLQSSKNRFPDFLGE